MLYTAKSHTGLVRQMNQDNYAVHTFGDWTLAVVADGMGGAAAGEVASKIAAEVIVREVESGLKIGADAMTVLRDAISNANGEIWKKSRSDVDYLGMGTTLVTALYDENRVILGHVGDSRAYRYTQEQLTQITRDHSLVAELVRRGQITENEALSHPQRNVVTRSLGTAQWSEPEIDTFNWGPGDILLLCTDGLTNCVSSEELASQMRLLSNACKGASVITQESKMDEAKASLEHVADRLIELTLKHGAPDNVTLVLTMHRKGIGAQ